MIDLAVEAESVERYRQAWLAALADRDATVAYASANKCDPGKDYWHVERAARRKYENAIAVYTALRGDL